MNIDPSSEEVQRWTAKRKAAVVLDLIAGKTSADSLQGFTVEGECRYWLHVAIDRYTGKVESELIERVTQ